MINMIMPSLPAAASSSNCRRHSHPDCRATLIQPFQQPERVVGFFNTCRQLYPVTRQTLRGIADQFQYWLKNWSDGRRIPVLDAPPGRRDDFVDPYFCRAKPDSVVVILKAREPARIMTAIGDRTPNRRHLQIANPFLALAMKDRVKGESGLPLYQAKEARITNPPRMSQAI